MDYQARKKMYAIKKQNENRIKKLVPNIQPRAGIYFFYRTDENDIKYGYIGKAETNILERLASHLNGYKQHIDLSIKKHGLYDKEKNPYGYKIKIVCYCPPIQCDELEQKYIKICANSGYQMRNTETGGTNGKTLMNERKEPKGYRDGIKQGRTNLARELKHIADTHLHIELNIQKKGNKVSQRQLEKFMDLLENPNKE